MARLPYASLIAKSAYVVLAGGSIFILFADWAYDDPFITFRYAQNLAQGLGFVYNPGERVLSTTTPLLALILAAAGLICPDLPRVAVLIGAASLALGALAIWQMARAWRAPVAGWVALLVYPAFPLLLTTLGSEMPLYLALSLGAFACYAQRRLVWCAIFAALAMLTRGDGVLVMGAILTFDLLSRPTTIRRWLAPIAIYAVIGAAWFIFAWLYFGAPFPATLAAKQSQGAMAVSQRFGAGLVTIFQGYFKWNYVLFALLAILGIIAASLHRRSWLLVLGWTLAYGLAYTALGVSRYFWYYAPLIPGLVVAAGLGCQTLSDWLALRTSARSRKPVAVLTVSLVLMLTIAQWNDAWLGGHWRDSRIAIYRAIGEWLDHNTGDQDSVGVLETGIIGYYSRRRMIDFAGLIQPETAAQIRPDSTYDDLAVWASNRYHPDYIITSLGMSPKLDKDRLDRGCVSAQVFEGARYAHSVDWVIYRCKAE